MYVSRGLASVPGRPLERHLSGLCREGELPRRVGRSRSMEHSTSMARATSYRHHLEVESWDHPMDATSKPEMPTETRLVYGLMEAISRRDTLTRVHNSPMATCPA